MLPAEKSLYFFFVVVPYFNMKMPPSQTKTAPESLLSLKQQVVPVVVASRVFFSVYKAHHYQRVLSSYRWSVRGVKKLMNGCVSPSRKL